MTTPRKGPCASCQDLQRGHLIVPPSKLKDGVENGCKACALLKESVARFRDIDNVREIRIVIDCAMYLHVLPKEKDSKAFILELYTTAGKPTRWPNIGLARGVTPGLKSTETLALLQQWLQDCRDRHPSCAMARSTGCLPTRVIDVGTSSEDTKLYISKAEKGSYAALSHCWGGHLPLTTTRDNLKNHETSIQFDSQSKTFVDAAEVTRRLGLRYLWIDSLCIVQDDPDDWEAEAAKMSALYRNATVTLSADGAENPSGGLFWSPFSRPSVDESHSITTEGANGDAAIVHARIRSAPPSDPGSAPHSSISTGTSKLSTRAWVVQERILSPRIIHFYKQELVWSCDSQQRCECLITARASLSGTFRRLLDCGETEPALFREWPRLISNYTAKDLTYTKDRLFAISGLASFMSQHTSSPYLCGMWLEDMAYSLLWVSNHEEAKNKPIQRMSVEPYAPSWAWASVTGPVRYIDRHLNELGHRRSRGDEIEPVFHVLGAAATPTTSNIFGPVDNGIVTIKGQVLPIRYDVDRKAWLPGGEDETGSNVAGGGPPGNASYAPRSKYIFDVLTESPEAVPQAATSGNFALLRAATYIWGGTYSTPSTEVVALFLMQVGQGGGKKTYKRLGIVLHAFSSPVVWKDVPTETVVLI